MFERESTPRAKQIVAVRSCSCVATRDKTIAVAAVEVWARAKEGDLVTVPKEDYCSGTVDRSRSVGYGTKNKATKSAESAVSDDSRSCKASGVQDVRVKGEIECNRRCVNKSQQYKASIAYEGKVAILLKK